jgi:hypothetical protein
MGQENMPMQIRQSQILSTTKDSCDPASTDLKTIRTFEEKIDLLIREKGQLEKLNDKICRILPNSELKVVVSDMIRTENEIEQLERNQIKIQGMLMESESEMRA